MSLLQVLANKSQDSGLKTFEKTILLHAPLNNNGQPVVQLEWERGNGDLYVETAKEYGFVKQVQFYNHGLGCSEAQISRFHDATDQLAQQSLPQTVCPQRSFSQKGCLVLAQD